VYVVSHHCLHVTVGSEEIRLLESLEAGQKELIQWLAVVH